MEKTELNSRLEKIRHIFEEIQDGNLEEQDIKDTLDQLLKIFENVAKLGIFSINEEFNEINTEDLKFLLIPYYQAELIQRFNENRLDKLNFAYKFYEEFFKILDLYKYFSKEVIYY